LTVAQKALLFGDDILAIATIGFGKFDPGPEMKFDGLQKTVAVVQ
jgi:hypothetical protein